MPHELTETIVDRGIRRAQRARIKATINGRISAAKTAARVARREPRRIGWAHVVAIGEEDPEMSADEHADSEAVSMRYVTDLLTSGGWRVTDVHTEDRGYDLLAERGAEQRCIEVKGRAGNASNTGIELTGGELNSADAAWRRLLALRR